MTTHKQRVKQHLLRKREEERLAIRAQSRTAAQPGPTTLIRVGRTMVKRRGGATVKEISTKAGVSVRTVRRWMTVFDKEGELVRYGIPVRYRLLMVNRAR